MVGWEGYYEVSADGAVYRVARGKGGIVGPLKPYRLKNGYYCVLPSRNDRRKHVAVHHAVAEAFLGPRNGLEVNHKNGVKTDNRLENLEYMTRAANANHAARLGLLPRGSSQWMARLTESDVRAIRKLRAAGVLQRVVAAQFAVTETTVNDIANSRTWRWLAA